MGRIEKVTQCTHQDHIEKVALRLGTAVSPDAASMVMQLVPSEPLAM